MEYCDEFSDVPKIYCFINGYDGGLVDVVALAEDGNCLAGHLSSNEYYAKHDIGIRSDWKHEEYKNHYPNGYILEWVDRMYLHTHEGLLVAVKKNRELPVEDAE